MKLTEIETYDYSDYSYTGKQNDFFINEFEQAAKNLELNTGWSKPRRRDMIDPYFRKRVITFAMETTEFDYREVLIGSLLYPEYR